MGCVKLEAARSEPPLCPARPRHLLIRRSSQPPLNPAAAALDCLRRSITSSRPSTLRVSLLSDQTPPVLNASTKTRPVAFGPVAEKLRTALPDSPLTVIEPEGKPVEIGVPRT